MNGYAKKKRKQFRKKVSQVDDYLERKEEQLDKKGDVVGKVLKNILE